MTHNISENHILFSGIKNSYKHKTKFMIYLDPMKKEPYIADYYNDNIRMDAFINPIFEEIIIAKNVYDYHFREEQNEIIFIAIEKIDTLNNIINYIFCNYGANFLLGTNKMEV